MHFSALVVTLAGLAPVAASASAAPAKDATEATAWPVAPVSGIPFQQQEAADEADGGLAGAEAVVAPRPLLPAATRGLDREFLVRLRRVVDRLATEHGMEAEIVEGLRTPERQMELYAQGRTAPGPVVTWTTNSLHLRGAAADLWLDGQPPEGERALILSRVAREEGLRTLYPFDSGHVELTGAGTGPDAHGEGPPPRTVPTAAPRAPNGVAVPAPVARPATPATPARPGGDAVALGPAGSTVDPAGVVVGTGPDVSAMASTTGAPDATPVPAVRGRAHEGSGQGDPTPHGRGGLPDPVRSQTPSGAGGEADGEEQVVRALTDATRRERSAASSGTEGDAVPRVPPSSTLAADVPSFRSQGPYMRADGVPTPAPGAAAPPEPLPEPVGPRMVRVPLEAGSEDGALRVGLRSGRVHAEVQVGDPALADRLMRNVREIRQSLGERGLDMGAWSVRVAAVTNVEGQAVRNGDSGPGDGFADAQSGHRSARDRAQDRERNARNGQTPHHEGEG